MARPKNRRRSVSKHARRQEVKRSVESVRRVIEDVWDPAIPAGEALTGLSKLFGDEPFPPALAALSAIPERRERANQLVEAALEQAPTSIQTLLFTADVALAQGRPDWAVDLLEPSFRPDADPRLSTRLVHAEIEAGRLGQAMERAEQLARHLVHNPDVQVAWGRVLTTAHARRLTGGECECGSHQDLDRCCGPAIAQILDRFWNRAELDRLEHALHKYWKRPALASVRKSAAEDWGLEHWPRHLDRPGMPLGIKLAEQRSWKMSPTRGRDDDPYESSHDDPDDDYDCPLGWFTEQPTTSHRLVELALDWLDEGRYGLWLVPNPEPSPGVMLVDLNSGARVYAEVAPGRLDGLAPWSVLIGPAIPLDGVWRLGPCVVANPDEGDRLAEIVDEMAEAVAAEVMGVRAPVPREDSPRPRGVWVLEQDAAGPGLTNLTSRVTMVALPDLMWRLESWRSEPVRMANTDGQPILLHEARLRVEPAALRELVERHPDLGWIEGDVAWWGRHLTDDEIAQQMAFLRQKATEEGWDVEDLEEEGPKRWLRGRLRADGEQWVAEVNSAERFNALCELFGDEGIDVIVETVERHEPPAIRRGMAGLSGDGAADIAWLETWPDTHILALGGLTPREAVDDPDFADILEAMVRRFEWDAFHRRGSVGADAGITRLRNELDLPAHEWW